MEETNINKLMDAIGINQTNTRGSFKTCMEQFRALKRIRLDCSIALDFYRAKRWP
jgi:hypothetical protein